MKIESAFEKRMKKIIRKPNKEKSQDADSICKSITSIRNNNFFLISSQTEKKFDIDEYIEEKCTCYRLVPKEGFNGRFLFYIYGGAMCLDMAKDQWRFITDIASRAGCGILIPMYPLSPENTCSDTFEMLYTTYERFILSRDVEETILIGDSYGAELALSLSILIWENGIKKPDKMILVSPVLDTEFLDREIEYKLLRARDNGKCNIYSRPFKQFLNKYWIKEKALVSKYTNPLHEDFTDICNEIIIVTSTDDVFGDYAKRFYEKVKVTGTYVTYLEYESMPHDFIIVDTAKKTKLAKKDIVDCIKGSYDHICEEALFPVKAVGEWIKKYPELVKDDEVLKLLCNTKYEFRKDTLNNNEYANILMASRIYAFDKKVKEFILKFPNATIVSVGAGISTMLSRVNNNRITWYSVDSPGVIALRRKFLSKGDKEIFIEKNVTDLTWLDDIKCNKGQGVMFVCCESIITHTPTEVKKFFNLIRDKFSGSEIIFDCIISASPVYNNLYYSNLYRHKRAKLCINDAHKAITDWSINNYIISEEPIMKRIKINSKLKLITRIKKMYNLISGNYKLVHLKLGHEKYEVDYM